MSKYNSDINSKNYYGLALNTEQVLIGWDLENSSNSVVIINDRQKLSEETEKQLKEYQNQRIERGFDDTELFDLDLTLVRFALPRVKRFLELEEKEFENFEQDSSQIQYFQDLRQIVLDLENYNHDTTDLTLFFKYFKQLWL